MESLHTIHLKVGKFVCKIYVPSTDKTKIVQVMHCLFVGIDALRPSQQQ